MPNLEKQFNDAIDSGIEQYLGLIQLRFLYKQNIKHLLPLLTKDETVDLLSVLEKKEIKMNVLINDLVEFTYDQVDQQQYSDINEPGFLSYLKGLVDNYIRLSFCANGSKNVLLKALCRLDGNDLAVHLCHLRESTIKSTQVDETITLYLSDVIDPFVKDIKSGCEVVAEQQSGSKMSDKDNDKLIRSCIPLLAQANKSEWFDKAKEKLDMKAHAENMFNLFGITDKIFCLSIYTD